MSAPTPHPPASAHIAVVNLTRASDRRERMEAEFASAGIAGAFFPAIDAREPENRVRLDQMPDRGPWGAVALHDKACTASHLALLEDFLGRDEDICLVLEDDVFLSPELSAWITDLSWWPAEADLVKLERWRDDKLLVVMGKSPAEHMGRKISRLYSRHSGTGGYMISRKGAEKVLAAARVDMPIDHLLFNVNISPTARGLNTYQVHPALLVQGNEPEAPAQNTRAQTAPAKPVESKLAKELRRGWHEVKVLPRLLALGLTGRATAQKITYAAHVAHTECHRSAGSAQPVGRSTPASSGTPTL